MRVVYLHGFASSPASSKAQFFSRKLRECGVQVEVPRLDGGDFEHLTITSQLAVVERTLSGAPAVLFGSSLGGYLAALYAARHPEIQKLVLLAPGFQFPSRWRQRYSPEELARWKEQGTVSVYHYGEGRPMPLSYRLIEDSALYEDEPDVHQPALIFHGTRDDIVPAEVSEAFVRNHLAAELHLMEAGHELTNVLEPMWTRTRAFLEI